jgi:hypothetical protein
MTTLASATSMFSSQQMLLMLAVFSSVGLLVALMLLCAKLFSGKSAAISAASIDADLERRRRVLEVERLEIENLERRQRLAREQAMSGSKAA